VHLHRFGVNHWPGGHAFFTKRQGLVGHLLQLARRRIRIRLALPWKLFNSMISYWYKRLVQID